MPEALYAPLLPCPFCGGTRAFVSNREEYVIHVGCRDCGAQVYGHKAHFASVEQAIAAWNTRADATCSLRGADEARQFPDNTCPSSRHAQMIGEALVKGEAFPQLSEEPEHCGQSILATVEALYRARTALRGGQQGWTSFHEARPPCDGETMFIGENEAGYIACFNRLTPDGYCFHDTAESEICVMSGLRMWKLVDRPAPPPSTHPQETQP